jgi:hypothetical protein
MERNRRFGEMRIVSEVEVGFVEYALISVWLDLKC